MKCIKCGQEMQQDSVGKYRCHLCGQTMDDLVYRDVITTIHFKPNEYQIITHCVICGKEVVSTANTSTLAEQIKVCGDCKNAIAWAKEKMNYE